MHEKVSFNKLVMISVINQHYICPMPNYVKFYFCIPKRDIKEKSKEFLESYKVEETLKKFCRFLPVPIYFEKVEDKKSDDKNNEDYNY